MRRAIPLFVFVLLAAHAAAADELRLKDGTKITGNIVGFEDGAFKVETAYGFAIVKKEKVESVKVAEWKSDAKPEQSAAKKETPSAKAAPTDAGPRLTGLRMGAAASASAADPNAAPQATATPSAPAEPAAKAPAPPVIREEMQGPYYVNLTYGFRMFKPPSWQVIEGARRALPNAVVAMGTPEETTLLVVGREPLTKSLEAHAAATEKRLREIYENYRPSGEQRASVAGVPAVERHFRGTADGRDWSATMLSFARGNELYTILGMTYADSDLIQIQENVITRTIASLQFTR